MGKRTGRCYLAAKHGQESRREGERERDGEGVEKDERESKMGRPIT